MITELAKQPRQQQALSVPGFLNGGIRLGIVALVSYTNSYLVSTPTLLQVGRGPFRNPRDIPYRQLRSYRVVPQDPDATDPDTKDLSQWNLEFKVPRANKYTKELRDPNLEYLVQTHPPPSRTGS